MYRTIGIDLAAQPERTAVCVIDWHPGEGANLVSIDRGLEDEQLLAAMGTADAVGIDAPFGWPRLYTDALRDYPTTGAWPLKPVGADPGWHLEVRFRSTDRAVHHLLKETRGVSMWPLSVSSDRIALCACRAAGLLYEHTRRTGRALDRTGLSSGVYEVYPAAALASWGLPHKGYKAGTGGEVKKTGAAAKRRDILQAVEEDARPWIDFGSCPTWRTALTETDDALDAFLCALVAKAAGRGDTVKPSASEENDAGHEGWIHVPTALSLPLLGS